MRSLLFLSGLVWIGSCKVRQPGDVRAEALVVLERAGEEGSVLSLTDLVEDGTQSSDVLQAPLPEIIRLWRRREGDGGSCRGTVEEIPLEDYVKGVLPHEWIASWDVASLEAGSIAIRTYASFWSTVGGKYQCADLDDTTWSQVYDDSGHPKTDAAVDATAGLVAMIGGALVYAEYSAENTEVTAHGVEDPVCAGQGLNGHGRGVCQWGTQRWALEGKTPAWIVEHYYPGAVVGKPEDHRRLDVVAASLRSRPDPVRVAAGSVRVLTLIATNRSDAPWQAGSIRLGTAHGGPSPSATVQWISPGIAVRNAERVGPGQRVRFEVEIQAGDGDRQEQLALFDGQGRRSDQVWDLAIRVTAARSEGPWIRVGAALGLVLGLLGLGTWMFLQRKRGEQE